MGRLVVAAHVVRVFLQQRMSNRTMKALGIVLDDQLPVRLQLVNPPLHQFQFFHSPGTEFHVKAGQMLSKRNRVG